MNPILIRVLVMLTFGVVVVGFALRSLRAQRLKERYALIMLFTGLPFLALAAWPDAVGLLGQAMQIDYRTVIILCLAAFTIVAVFNLMSIISVQERRITTLAQMVGILMEERKRAGLSDKPE